MSILFEDVFRDIFNRTIMTKNSVRFSMVFSSAYPRAALAAIVAGLCVASAGVHASESESPSDILLAPGKTVVVMDQKNIGVQHEITAPADSTLNLSQALAGASVASFGSGRLRGANAAQIGADGKIVLRAVRAAADVHLPTIDGGTVLVSRSGTTVYGNVVGGAAPAPGLVNGANLPGKVLLNPLSPADVLATGRLAEPRIARAELPVLTLVPTAPVLTASGNAGMSPPVNLAAGGVGPLTWNSFNVGSGSVPGNISVGGGPTLNSVTGPGPGAITGALVPTGKIVLISPSGLPLTGGSAAITTGGLTPAGGAVTLGK